MRKINSSSDLFFFSSRFSLKKVSVHVQKGLRAVKTLRLSKQWALLIRVRFTSHPLGTIPPTPGSGCPLNGSLRAPLHNLACCAIWQTGASRCFLVCGIIFNRNIKSHPKKPCRTRILNLREKDTGLLSNRPPRCSVFVQAASIRSSTMSDSRSLS